MNINGTHYRTIWTTAEPSGSVFIIDQRHLPHHLVVEELHSCQMIWAAIREMHVRGAGLIGATAAYGMYLASLEASPTSFTEDLTAAANRLATSRPTAKNLSWAIDRCLHQAARADNIEEKRQSILRCAMDIADEDASFCQRIGQHGASLIEEIYKKKNGNVVNILTHCNAGWLAFVDYGSATAPIYAARDAGIPLHIWVDETRPWLQGAKLTAWELQQEGIPCTLIADNTGGHLMQRGEVDLVLVGADRVTRNGDAANKIGTYLKALAAKDNDIPFYVALPSSTFDWQLNSGSDIPIEIRSGKELIEISGITETGEQASIAITDRATPAMNVAFDVTPARLISGLITERGITRAEEKAICALFADASHQD